MKTYELAVIGSGPGGYVAAIRAGILGLKTAVIEKDPYLGGTCLHRGCIPTKALLHTAHLYREFEHASEYGISAQSLSLDYRKVQSRKAGIVDRLAKGIAYLLKKRKVDVLTGTGRIIDPNTVGIMTEKGEEKIGADRIIIATGSAPAHLPHIVPDHKTILDSDDMLVEGEIPGTMAVIGAGAVGVEFASIFNSFGTKVTVVELLPHIVPLEDEDISRALAKALKKKGMEIHTSSEVNAVEESERGAKLRVVSGEKEFVIEVEKVLLSVGRRPVTENLGLEQTGIEADPKGYINVNEFMQTSIPHIYAIGDIVRTPWLAHVASAEGVLAVNHMAGKQVEAIDYMKTPNCTYCSPEVASVGYTERAAKDAGYGVKTGQFPFSAIGKAQILGQPEGFIKIVGDEAYDEVLGVHIVGPGATELIAEACLGMKLETTVEEVTRTVHAHPTLSEAMLEAAHSVYGEAIHI